MRYANLEKSFFFININKDNSWRTSAKSLLVNLTDNKKYYLTKECRAECIGQYPFLHQSKSELCLVVEDKKLKYLIRNNSVLKKNDFDNHHYDIHSLKENEDKVIVTETDYDLLDYNNTLNFLNNRSIENIYCKLDYNFQNKKYSIFSKVEYINFPGSNSKNRKIDTSFLQPIMGYVPFEKDGKIYIAYVARYTSPKLEGNLEFILRANANFSDFNYTSNRIKGKLKRFLVSLLNFIKVSEFSLRISIDHSKCEFFKKNAKL